MRTQRGADRLARNLRKEGFSAGELHGGMSQPQRERALGRFASGANDVLVATDVAARGLDLDDITHVINFDAPADEKAYVHRVGRTARAGRGGEGVTFVTPDQRLDVGRIAKRLHLHAEFEGAGLSAPEPVRKTQGSSRRNAPRKRRSSGARRTARPPREGASATSRLPNLRVGAHAAVHVRGTGGAREHEVHELRASVQGEDRPPLRRFAKSTPLEIAETLEWFERLGDQLGVERYRELRAT